MCIGLSTCKAFCKSVLCVYVYCVLDTLLFRPVFYGLNKCTVFHICILCSKICDLCLKINALFFRYIYYVLDICVVFCTYGRPYYGV